MNSNLDILSATLDEQYHRLQSYDSTTDHLDNLTSSQREAITELSLSILGKTFSESELDPKVSLAKRALSCVFQQESSLMQRLFTRSALRTVPKETGSPISSKTQEEYRAQLNIFSGKKEELQEKLYAAVLHFRRTPLYKDQISSWGFSTNLSCEIDKLFKIKINQASSLEELYAATNELCLLLRDSREIKEKNQDIHPLFKAAYSCRHKVTQASRNLSKTQEELPEAFHALLNLLTPYNTLGKWWGKNSAENQFLAHVESQFHEPFSPTVLMTLLKGDPIAPTGTPEHLGVYGLIHKSLRQAKSYQAQDLTEILRLEIGMAQLEKMIENHQTLLSAANEASPRRLSTAWFEMICSRFHETMQQSGIPVSYWHPKMQSAQDWLQTVYRRISTSPGPLPPQLESLQAQIVQIQTSLREKPTAAITELNKALKSIGLMGDEPASRVDCTDSDMQKVVQTTATKRSLTDSHLFLTAKSCTGTLSFPTSPPTNFSLPLTSAQKKQLATSLIALNDALISLASSTISSPEKDAEIAKRLSINNFYERFLPDLSSQDSTDNTSAASV